MPTVPTVRLQLQKAGAGGGGQEAAGAALSSRHARTTLAPALAKLKALARELDDVRPEAIPTHSVSQAARVLQAPAGVASWDRIDRLVTAWIREVVRYEEVLGAVDLAQAALPAAMVDALFELLACLDDERREALRTLPAIREKKA